MIDTVGAHTRRVLLELLDPQASAPLPDPHMDLPKFIEDAKEAHENASPAVRERLITAISFATDLLAYLNMSACDARIFKDRPDLEYRYRELREKIIRAAGYDPCAPPTTTRIFGVLDLFGLTTQHLPGAGRGEA